MHWIVLTFLSLSFWSLWWYFLSSVSVNLSSTLLIFLSIFCHIKANRWYNKIVNELWRMNMSCNLLLEQVVGIWMRAKLSQQCSLPIKISFLAFCSGLKHNFPSCPSYSKWTWKLPGTEYVIELESWAGNKPGTCHRCSCPLLRLLILLATSVWLPVYFSIVWNSVKATWLSQASASLLSLLLFTE